MIGSVSTDVKTEREQPQCLTKGDLRPVSDIKQCTQVHHLVHMGKAVPNCSSQGLNAQVAWRLNQYRNHIEVVGECVLLARVHTPQQPQPNVLLQISYKVPF